MKKRKRWVILAVIVIAVAAVAAGAVWWFGRDDSASVHYLTSEVTKGTISQTVEADFTLSSASGATSIALGGGAASDSSSDSSSASADTQATSSLSWGTAVVVSDGAAGSAVTTTYAALTTTASTDGDAPRASDASGSPSPSPSSSPSPSPTATSTPTPSPTATNTGFPSPSPSAAPTGGSVPSGGSGASSGASSGPSAGSTSTTATDSTSTSSVSGVVSRLSLPAGAKPTTLRRLLYISGKPVFAFVSPTPLWKNLSTSLSSGSQRVNVAVLQKALMKQGYYKKAINGNFTSATKKAFMRWQKANGLSKTGVVDVTRFVWMPTGSVLTAWSVNLGSHVSSGTALASVVSPSRLMAEAQISQADIADLKVGQEAQMTIDGYDDDTFTGRISFISSEPASSSSASGSSASSTSTQYSITVSPQDLPKLAKSGMTGTLDIVIQQVSDVLIVPTSAVSGSSTTSFVRVMQDGKPVYRQVQTGMATASSTEITSGLAEGETVVTGQYTDGADSTGASSSQTQRSGGSILPGGGAFQIDGGPPAGMPAPGGGQ